MYFTKYQIFNSYEELGENGIVIISDKDGFPKQIPIRTKIGIRIAIGNYEDANGDNFCLFLRVINSETKEAAVIVADNSNKMVREFKNVNHADKSMNMKLTLLQQHIPNFQIIFDGNRNDAFKS